MEHLELGPDACPVTDVCIKLGTFTPACTTARVPPHSGEPTPPTIDHKIESRLAVIEEEVGRMRACMSSLVQLMATNFG